MALNGVQLIRRVKKRAGIGAEDDVGGRFDDDDDILPLINTIQDEIVNETRCVKGRRKITLSSGDSVISLSLDDSNDNLDILRVYRVTIDGKRIKRAEMEWLDKNFPNWDNENAVTGEPSYYYPIEEGIGLYRKPDGNYVLRVYFTKKPTEITNSSSSYPFNNITQMYPYHKLVVSGAAWLVMQELPETKQSRKDEQAAQYLKGIEKMRVDLYDTDDAADLDFNLPNRQLIAEDSTDISVRFG